jgi:hypothetical protein
MAVVPAYPHKAKNKPIETIYYNSREKHHLVEVEAPYADI